MIQLINLQRTRARYDKFIDREWQIHRYLYIPLILLIHLERFKDTTGQQESSTISWSHFKIFNHKRRCVKRVDTKCWMKNGCGFSQNTCRIVCKAYFKTIARQFMCICCSKNNITSNASRYDLCNDVLVCLISRLRFKLKEKHQQTKQLSIIACHASLALTDDKQKC